MVELTNDQKNGLLALDNWYKSKEGFITLNGSAGTGKTFLANYFLKAKQINSQACLAAPTHKAKSVIAARSTLPAFTLHTLLGIGLNVDLADFDPLNPAFDVITKQKIEDYRFVVIDESSMINTELYDMLKEVCHRSYIKVLFIGDEVQVNPINESVSPVFSQEHSQVITLSEIVRQEKDNPLIKLLTTLRDDIINGTNDYIKLIENETEVINNYKGYTVTKSNQFMYDKAVDLFKHNVDAKILAWTNAIVTNWNNSIVVGIFETLGLFHNQLITGIRTIKEGKSEPIIENSKEYMIIGIREGFKYIDNTKVSGKYLKLRNQDDITEVFCIGSASKGLIGDMIYNQTQKAKITGGGRGWGRFYKFRASFILGFNIMTNHGTLIDKQDFTFGYCSTVHKSQGSTYKIVFIDYRDISRNQNNTEMKRLLYVALSRASDAAYILI